MVLPTLFAKKALPDFHWEWDGGLKFSAKACLLRLHPSYPGKPDDIGIWIEGESQVAPPMREEVGASGQQIRVGFLDN